jgi:hypothetical protein
MGELLLHNPWVHFYLLWVGVLVVINITHATIRKPEPARKNSMLDLETKSAERSRDVAA